jgi:hypothetical protein
LFFLVLVFVGGAMLFASAYKLSLRSLAVVAALLAVAVLASFVSLGAQRDQAIMNCGFCDTNDMTIARKATAVSIRIVDAALN